MSETVKSRQDGPRMDCPPKRRTDGGIQQSNGAGAGMAHGSFPGRQCLKATN